MSSTGRTLRKNQPPDDIRTYLLWYEDQRTPTSFAMHAEVNPDAHEHLCRVYWGSHGCERPRGHKGAHWCDCCECANHPEDGCVAGPPYYGWHTHLWGEDVPWWRERLGRVLRWIKWGWRG